MASTSVPRLFLSAPMVTRNRSFKVTLFCFLLHIDGFKMILEIYRAFREQKKLTWDQIFASCLSAKCYTSVSQSEQQTKYYFSLIIFKNLLNDALFVLENQRDL